MNHYHCEVTIELADSDSKIYENSVESGRELAAKSREIEVQFQRKTLFTRIVPETVYNPYHTTAAPLFMDLIIKGLIPVEGLRVIDLGCGSGVIGLAAALMNCERVLYTDINANVISIGQHNLFRPQDRVAVQNFCETEQPASYDLVLTSTPSIIVPSNLPNDSYEQSVFRETDFISKMITDVAKVLVPSGTFIFFYRMYPSQIDLFAEMIAQLNEGFDMSSLHCLFRYPEGGESNFPGIVNINGNNWSYTTSRLESTTTSKIDAISEDVYPEEGGSIATIFSVRRK